MYQRDRSLRWLWIVVLALFLSIGSLGSAGAALRPVTLQDLDTGYPGNTLSLSPDETLLAVENNSRLVLIAYPSGHVVQELGDGLMPQWSPTGDRLAFYSIRSGQTQLWIWSRGGQVRQLTNFPDGVNPDFYTRYMGYVVDALRYAWSPDGTKIAFASRVPVPRSGVSLDAPLVLNNTTDPNLTTTGVCALPAFCAIDIHLEERQLVEGVAQRGQMLVNQLFVTDVTTGTTTQVTSPDRLFYDPVWTKDGSAILAASFLTLGEIGDVWTAFSGATAKPDVQIVRIDPTAKNVDVLFDNVGAARNLELSLQGNQLFYLSSPGILDPAYLQVGDLTNRRATAVPWHVAVEEIQMMADGQLGAAYRQDDKTWFADVAADATAPSGAHQLDSPFDMWFEDRGGATVWIDAVHNVEYLAPHASVSTTIFTFKNPDLELGKEETITWKNTRGDTLHGSLLYPLGYVAGRRYPVIVDAYPLAHADGWMHSMGGNETWAAAGYVVFMPGERAPHVWMNASNPAFGAAGKGPNGFNVALDDVMSGVDELTRRGIIDPNRMCLYGHSNGGGAVSYLVTMTNRFKCAVVAAPAMADWLAPVILTTGGREEVEQFSGGYNVNRDIGAFVKMSSVFNLYKSRTPMLIVVGDDDATLLDTISVYDAVRDTGTPITFVRYPGQGHVLTGAAMADFWNRQMEFFAKYLGGTLPPIAERP